MKTLTPELKAHLAAGGPFIMADLYTIVLVTSDVLRWADFDIPLTHPGTGYVYASECPALERTNTRVILGLEVDTLDLSIFPREADVLGGVSMLTAARRGAFDGAYLVLDRAFLADDLSVIGTVNLFAGRFGETTVGRTEIQVLVSSPVEAYNIQLPRNLEQPSCVNRVFDAGCGLDRASWGVAGTVASGSTVSTLHCNLTNGAGWFNRGYIRFISGDQVGARRTVKSYSPGQIALFLPLLTAPAVGDLFIAYPGCDGRQITCLAKFNNRPHFRGCPYIPVPETAL